MMIYDYPGYYDLLFGADWKGEFEFLAACFERFAKRRVRRLFEPACGTGRLLVKFAEVGYSVAGNDLNAKAVAYCNARLQRRGFSPSVMVSDMADFRLARKVDAAFNTINSFRHLLTGQSAQNHLHWMAESLASGGIYVLGLHLTPARPLASDQESFSAQRGRVRVDSRMWSMAVDRRRRLERVAWAISVRAGKRKLRFYDEFFFRTYTAAQMEGLLRRSPAFELIATYDFNYCIDLPIDVDKTTEDVVYVLRRR